MKILLILLIPIIGFGQENIRFSKTIKTQDLEKHLKVLASDSLEGRETGKRGQKMAAEYIRAHFISLSLIHI